MQFIAVGYDMHQMPRGARLSDFLHTLVDLKHGSIVAVPKWITLEIMEMKDEDDGYQPDVFLLDGNEVRRVG